jgi:methyl-accepting chemotaxis protein
MSQRSTRSNYFIQAGLQIKFTIILAMIVLLVVSITAFNLYIIADYVVQKQDTLPTIRSLGEFIQGVLSVVGWRIALLGFVCFLIIWIIGIFFSHQFAGPSYKLEKCLREIAQGNLSFDIKLRNGDALHNVADSVNLLVERFRGVVGKSRELGQAIRQHSEQLTKDSAVQENRVLLEKVGELEDLLAGFQLTREEAGTGAVPADAASDTVTPEAS